MSTKSHLGAVLLGWVVNPADDELFARLAQPPIVSSLRTASPPHTLHSATILIYRDFPHGRSYPPAFSLLGSE